ncbi:hypothetical protein [Oceanobacillus limi]|nr:hypothetical protein [Oceanobacillus limi]
MTHRVSVESTTKTPGRGDYLRFWEEEYRVLVPLESTSPQSTDDIIANLVGRLAKAERKIAELTEQSDSNAKDIRTWADDYTEFKSSPSLWATQSDVLSINAELGILRETSFDWSEKIEQKIEMLIDDVVAIDERTQPLTTEGVSELSEELTKVVTQAIDDKLRKVGR